jgi:heat-inducible transcriptional repressor
MADEPLPPEERLSPDDRRARILRAVVEEYVETAQPVGSGHVARAPGLNVSSATVRNDMAALEHEGFLAQPHTSAGRIPTDKGYRYFVDHLGEPARLEGGQAQQVRSFFAKAHGELEQMLHDTSRLLSNLTDSAAVVIGPPHDAGTIRSVQLVGLSGSTVLLVVVLSNGTVEKASFDLADEVDEVRIGAATAHLAAAAVGQPFSSLALVTDVGDPATDSVLAAVRRSVDGGQGHQDDPVYVDGASRVAASLNAIETVTEVLRILEEQFVVVTLLRDVLDRGLQVAIGSETGMAPLAECALVVAPYEIDGQAAGSIGVLGPTRMNYPQALAAVAVVSKRLGHRLSEG